MLLFVSAASCAFSSVSHIGSCHRHSPRSATFRLCAPDDRIQRQPPLSDLDLELDEIDMPDDFDPNEESWVDANFVADYGWDPLGLSRVDLTPTRVLGEQRPFPFVLRDYREAELRHGRLAMLAAIAWPVQELLSPVLSRVLREPQLLIGFGILAAGKPLLLA